MQVEADFLQGKPLLQEVEVDGAVFDNDAVYRGFAFWVVDKVLDVPNAFPVARQGKFRTRNHPFFNLYLIRPQIYPAQSDFGLFDGNVSPVAAGVGNGQVFQDDGRPGQKPALYIRIKRDFPVRMGNALLEAASDVFRCEDAIYGSVQPDCRQKQYRQHGYRIFQTVFVEDR